MKFTKLIGFLFISAYFLTSQLSYSQIPLCPPGFDQSSWNSNSVTYYDELHPVGMLGGLASLSPYYIRSTPDGSAAEVVIDWSKLHNNSHGLLTDEQLKGLIQIAIASGNLTDIAVGQTKEFDFIYQSQCKAYRWCYAEVISQQEIVCQDPGWTPPDPEIFTDGTLRLYRWGTLEYCGEKCCRQKVVVKKLDISTSRPNVEIVSNTLEDYPGSSCPPSTIMDCHFLRPSSCTSDCKK